MTERIPTRLGDVLILWTTQSYAIHAVGRVSKDGQQDFSSSEANVTYEIGYAAAVAQAKARVLSGGRVFFRNIDTGDWNQIAS
jgi:ribosomal protein S28E/S33